MVSLLVMGGWLSSPASGQTRARVHGLVVDAQHGKPVAGTLVRLLEADVSAETSERGQFTMPPIEPGKYTIVVECLGYQTRRSDVVLQPGGELEVTIELAQKAIELEPIVVTARSGKLTESGFYDRRDTGGIKGHYITYDDLVRRNAMGLTDALVNVAGVRVHYIQPGRTTVRFNRHVPNTGPDGRPQHAFAMGGGLPGCEPDLYVDGRLYRNSSPPMQTGAGGGTVGWKNSISRVDDFNAIPVSEIEGVEVYVGAAVPPFVYNTACGVILIWTRR